MKMLGLAYLIAAIIAAAGGNTRQIAKNPVPEYQAPAWEYVEWATVEGQDGGEIDVSKW